MWEPDTQQFDGQNHAIVKTIFPIKKYHKFDQGDTKIIVEKCITDWAKDRANIKKAEDNIHPIEDDYGYIWAMFYEGKLHSTHFDMMLIVE